MRRLLVVGIVAVVAAVVALLAAQPWDDSAYTGRRPIPDRAGVKDCGLFVREVTSGGITAGGWNCFTTAMKIGRPARLRLTQFTTEGDPTFTTYTTEGGGSATVLEDARLDHFGGNGSRVHTQSCRRPETRPIARGLFLDCSLATEVANTAPLGSIATVFCEFAIDRHIIGARLTTLARLRAYNVGGPPPGLRPGKNLAPSRLGVVRAAWCWTDDPTGTGSPGMWTLYGALATGESAVFISTGPGPTPPSAPISIR